MKKKLFCSIAISFCLVFSLLPPAFAAHGAPPVSKIMDITEEEYLPDFYTGSGIVNEQEILFEQYNRLPWGLDVYNYFEGVPIILETPFAESDYLLRFEPDTTYDRFYLVVNKISEKGEKTNYFGGELSVTNRLREFSLERGYRFEILFYPPIETGISSQTYDYTYETLRGSVTQELNYYKYYVEKGRFDLNIDIKMDFSKIPQNITKEEIISNDKLENKVYEETNLENLTSAQDTETNAGNAQSTDSTTPTELTTEELTSHDALLLFKLMKQRNIVQNELTDRAARSGLAGGSLVILTGYEMYTNTPKGGSDLVEATIEQVYDKIANKEEEDKYKNVASNIIANNDRRAELRERRNKLNQLIEALKYRIYKLKGMDPPKEDIPPEDLIYMIKTGEVKK